MNGPCCYIYGDGYVLPTSDFYKIKDFLVAFNSNIPSMSRELGNITKRCIFCARTLTTATKKSKMGYEMCCERRWNPDFFKDREEIFGSYGIMKYPSTIDDIFTLVDEDDIPFFVHRDRQEKLKEVYVLANTGNASKRKRFERDALEIITSNLSQKNAETQKRNFENEQAKKRAKISF